MIIIQYRCKGTCEYGDDYMLFSMAVMSGLPEGLLVVT